MNLEEMTLEDFLKNPIPCSCGRIHSFSMKAIEICSGALKSIPALVKTNGYKKPFILSDINTYKAAAAKLTAYLEQDGIPFSLFVLKDSALVPDEKTLGSVLMHFDPSCDLLIAVGSGTVNDITRFTSHRLKLPYFIAATAPSMDGYASTVAPLIRNNLKTTFECHMPQAIIADLDIVSQAPMEMIAAGFGDILGKYTSLVDWKLSAIINDEYYCDTIVDIMRISLERTIALHEGAAKRDKAAIGKLMEALVLAGIAMSYAGNSRPASGSEHHLSHFWEMRYLLDGRKAVLHGSKVGIAAALVLKLHQYLKEENLSPTSIKNSPLPSNTNWEAEIRRVYGKAAEGILELEKTAQKNAPHKHTERIKAAAKHWDEIMAVLNTLPPPQTVIDLLTSVQGPVHPSQVGIDRELVKDGVLYAKELRARYTVLQLLWDLDLLPSYAERLADWQI